MIEITGVEQRDWIVDGEDLELVGVIVGRVTVPRGAFTLNGAVNGNVTVEIGGTHRLNGVMNGDLRNAGGTMEVFGVVNGTIHRERGQTFVAPAIVRPRRT